MEQVEKLEAAELPAEAPPPPARYKIICRVTDGRYTEELRCDDLPRTAPYSPEEENALRLLHAFSPESRTRALCQQTPDGVLVFRTDAAQMGEFEQLLHPESAEESPAELTTA